MRWGCAVISATVGLPAPLCGCRRPACFSFSRCRHRSPQVCFLSVFFFGVSLFTAQWFDVSCPKSTRTKDKFIIVLKRENLSKMIILSEVVFFENGSRFPFMWLCPKRKNLWMRNNSLIITVEIKFFCFLYLFFLDVTLLLLIFFLFF